jgi:hypothetical protein
MSIFPALVPSTRTYSPGEFPHTPHPLLSGSEIRVRHSNTVLGVRLRLTFQAASSADILAVRNHYNGRRGGFLPFAIPDELLSGVETPADFTPAGHQWKYASRPRVVDVPIAGTTPTNRHDLVVELVTVPPENTIVSGARITVRATVRGGSAQLGAYIESFASVVGGAVSVVTAPTEADGAAITVDASVAGGAASAEDPWTPADISTALWLDASDSSTITTAGAAVSAWNDKSGNARHFEQATGSLQPAHTTAALNGLAVVDFNLDYLTSSAATSTWTFLHDSTGSSVFMVVKAGTGSNPNDLYGIAGTNQLSSTQIGWALLYDDRSSQSRNDAALAWVGNGSAGNPTISNTTNDVWTANAYQVVGVVSDPGNGTAASRSFVYMNGGTALANNAAGQTRSTSTASHNLTIGAVGAVVPLIGGIAEFIIVSGIASADTRQRIEGYLAHKWGLTAGLPSGHPYKTTPP